MNAKEQRLQRIERLIQQLEQQLEALDRHSDFLTGVRMWLVIIGLPAIWGAFALFKFVPGVVVVVVLVVVFTLIVREHRTVDASRQRHVLWVQIKRQHAARLKLAWDDIPLPPTAEVSARHPFAFDLDLTGPRSLHHLLDTSASHEGSQRLQAWLLSTDPVPATIAHRQTLLRELIPLKRFRDRLTLVSRLADSGLSARWSGARLMSRLTAEAPPAALRPTLAFLFVLAMVNAALFVLHAAGVLPPFWIGTLLVYMVVSVVRRDLVGDLFDAALDLVDSLRRLGAVLGFLESYPYNGHDNVKALCAPLLNSQTRPSMVLRRVVRVASAASLQANFFLWLPVNILVPWDMFFAYRLSRYKAELASYLPEWLDVWAELEALNALATFAYLNPEYVFPEVLPTDRAVRFDAAQIGHPLIPYRAKVCNDFSIAQRGDTVIITGSNMSGKSSFLRTIGVNMVLAYAGGVVNAGVMQVSIFRLFTSIRVTDSVIDGISYFYAEVQRLRALLDALDGSEARPLFFLIDEIFRGTNNRERLIGSRAYIKALVSRGGTGLIATHDLELVGLVDTIPQVANYHFRETVEDGQMRFDYTLRPGPCPTTNALEIMRLEGLPID